MGSPNYSKLQDRLSPDEARPKAPSLDLSALTGLWLNTNPASRGVAKAALSERDGRLIVRAWGVADAGPLDWGETIAHETYGDSIRAARAIAFRATYDFGFLVTELEANIAKGLLIIASMNHFEDGDPRPDYFGREFFAKIGESQGQPL